GGGKKSTGRAGKAPAKPKKGRSGNPAKRAAQERDEAMKPATVTEPAAAADFELPDDLKKLLGG
ncbi:MAG: signal recognition particle protein, partial [Candidatus Nanopelagicales bacterium]